MDDNIHLVYIWMKGVGISSVTTRSDKMADEDGDDLGE